MRNLLALAAAALVIFAGLGWYLGWYQVKTEPAGDGHRQVTIDIDGPKIGKDLKKGEEKVHELIGNKGTGPGTVQNLPPPPPPRQPALLPPQTAQEQPPQGPPTGGGSWAFPGQDSLPPPPGGVRVTSGGGDNYYVPPPLPAVPPPPGPQLPPQ
jgi:hypothetical protein